MNEISEAQVVRYARIAGAVYLLYFLAAFGAAFLTRGLVVSDDVAATARGIIDHETRYRAAFAVGLLANVLYIAVTGLFYRLFERVSQTLSLLAALVSLVGCTVQIGAGVFQLAPLVVLRDATLSAGAGLNTLQTVAMLSLKLYSQTFYISLVLFAVYDLLLGYLIVKARFLPKAIGVFLMIAGVGWLAFVWPPAALAVASIILPLGALAEIVFMLWLVVKGVDASAWHGSLPN
jgi:hypothetical protein